jgi:eukaryotic-like serine/threonine-protein kinase
MRFPRETRIGPYRIEGLIAAGGMGEVYKAWHTHLDRYVAIKTVAEHSALSPQALKRFSREARLVSQLEHPNICRVYDFIEYEGQSLLILEYLEGEPLSARLARERPSVSEILRIGAEIADALDCAHTHGLIHRDLKPSNVMLTAAGAKVLDFGLVKRTARPGSDDAEEPTASESISEEEALLGTLPYMAPEQVEGNVADPRTDIYALGVILYQAATGRLPFVKRHNAALAAAILRDSPVPVDTLAPSTPAPVAHVIGRCLEKDPRNRWQSARDLASELAWLMETSGRQPRGRERRMMTVPRAGAAVLVILIVGTIGWAIVANNNGGRGERLVASSIFAPPGVVFPTNHSDAVVSPDGERVLLSGIDSAGRSWLWVRPLSEPNVRRIDVAPGGHTPFWAPDGQRIGYFSRNDLRIVDLEGGPSQLVASVSLESRGATWSTGGVILYAPEPDSGLYRVSPGSPPVRVTDPDRSKGEIGHLWPHFLPDGEHFLYLVTSAIDSVQGIYLASLSDPSGRKVLSSATSAWYANGRLLYLQDGALVARPFDPESGRLTGQPAVISSPVASIETLAAFSASTTGVLTYSGGESKDVTELTWRDTLGRTFGIEGEAGRYRNPTLSRDGWHLAVERDADIWVRDLRSNRMGRLNEGSLQPRNPVWAPDGKSLLFESLRADGWAIYRWAINGTGPPEVVLVSATAKMPTDWSPDGRLVAFAERTRRGDYDITVLDLTTSNERVWFGDSFDEVTARFSRSGRLIAFGSNMTGSDQIFVEPVPATGLRCSVSVDGGMDPEWGADDRTLFFLDPGGTLMQAHIDLAHGCAVEPPRALFETGINPRTSRNHFAVSPIHDRILVNSRTMDPRSHTVGVLINWNVLSTNPNH